MSQTLDSAVTPPPPPRAAFAVLRDNLTLIPFLLAGGAATAGFQLLMARVLPPAAYVEAFVMLAAISLLATPSNLIQTVITRSTAHMVALEQLGDLRAVTIIVARRLAMAALALILLFVVLAPVLQDTLRLTSVWPVIIGGFAAGLLLLEPLVRGLTQGARDFVGHGSILAAHGLARLSVGALAIGLGGGATGALLASPASALGGIGAGALAVRRLLRVRTAGAPARIRQAHLWDHTRVGLIMATMAAMLHMDGLIVRAFHPTVVAADYAALAVVARTVFWGGVSAGIVLLPYVVRCATRGEDFVRAYLVSMTLMALASGAAGIVVLGWPAFPYGVIFGDTYAPNTELLPAYVAAAAMLAVTTMTANLHVGASNLRVWWPLTAIVVLVVIGMLIARDSPAGILAVVVAGDAAAMLYLIAEAIGLTRRRAFISYGGAEPPLVEVERDRA